MSDIDYQYVPVNEEVALNEHEWDELNDDISEINEVWTSLNS